MKSTLASRQLHAFAAVAHHGSYTRAARELFVTQSAVTHSIQTLEGILGVRLFSRTSGILQLTPPGRKILTHTRKILREMDQIRRLAVLTARPGAARVSRLLRAA